MYSQNYLKNLDPKYLQNINYDQYDLKDSSQFTNWLDETQLFEICKNQLSVNILVIYEKIRYVKSYYKYTLCKNNTIINKNNLFVFPLFEIKSSHSFIK